MVWDKNTIAVIGAIIICGIVSAILLSGNGAFMIAGFNMLSRKKQEKIDTPTLCRFVGKLMLSVTIALVISLIYLMTEAFILLAAVAAIFAAVVIAIAWGSIHYIILPLRN